MLPWVFSHPRAAVTVMLYQGDDGWHSVVHKGVPLATYRARYLRLQQQGADEVGQQGLLPVLATPVKLAEGYCALQDASPGDAGGTAAEIYAEMDAEAEAEAEVGADQWVQCDRCRTQTCCSEDLRIAKRPACLLHRCKTWRVVPPEDWEDVQADERPTWLCEYADEAGWDLTKTEPFTPACSADA